MVMMDRAQHARESTNRFVEISAAKVDKNVTAISNLDTHVPYHCLGILDVRLGFNISFLTLLVSK